jgi:hypothetical protein
MGKFRSLLLMCAVCLASCRIQRLQIVNDTRVAFAIDSFSFVREGTFELVVSEASILGGPEPYIFGFAVLFALSKRDVDDWVQNITERQNVFFRKMLSIQVADFGNCLPARIFGTFTSA